MTEVITLMACAYTNCCKPVLAQHNIKEVKEFEQMRLNTFAKFKKCVIMIKLICSDVDGTLLNQQREVDVITREVFSALTDKVEVVLASSRMPKALYHIQKDLSITHSPVICYNGALVLKSGDPFSDEKILFSSTIQTESLDFITQSALGLDLHVSLYHNNTWFSSRNDYWTEREINNTKVTPDIIFDEVEKFQQNGMKGAHKIMLMGDGHKIDEIENEIKVKLKVSLCRAKETYLEITPEFTNKSKGLFLLIDSLKQFNHIGKEDIMAFGDNHNDFELLNDIKYGIAVGNATESLKEIAYSVTKSNKENGVAWYLKEHFKI
jgi:Cof subfamily protein (haloacid dehalogenase superfamily)